MNRNINFSNRVHILHAKNYIEASAHLPSLLKNLLIDNNMSEDWSGKKVVIKPNLLANRKPDMGVTSNPLMIETAALFFVERGAYVQIADSPGGLYHPTLLSRIYETTGMKVAAENSGASLNLSVTSEKLSNFNVITPLANADLIVNMARMKTHMLCDMTAAVKNLFGSIPGLQKAECHAKYPDKKDFCKMLVDLCLTNAPQINVIDGVVAMEGNGPADGTLRRIGALLGSANPFALDLACAHIMGYAPEEVYTVSESIARGLCPKSINELVVLGENIEKYTCNFKRPNAGRSARLIKVLPASIAARFRKEKRPHIVAKKCVGCGECARCCPAETIKVVNHIAQIDHATCIKCYCCQELCPHKAVIVR